MLRLKPSAQLWLCWTLPMPAEVARLRLGIDLGGSKIAGVVLDRTGASLAQHRLPAPQHDYAATLSAIVEMVGTLQQLAGGSATVGIGMPGSIAPGGGGVQNANSTWLNGRPFAHDLAQVLNMPVRLANDANCFALSEAVDGAGAGARSLFGVILGTGCGGGLIFEGKLIDGPRGTGGEWGHNPLPWAEASEHPGPLCWCGRRGCLERWVSGPGLEADHLKHTGAALSAAAIAAAADAGSAAAGASLQRHANTLLGFSARRTLAAAQRLYEEHKALTYPRTNSRFLTGDMIPEIKPIAALVGHNAAYRRASEYVTSLDRLPLGRVVNDKKVEDHHAIIPTRSEHDLGRMGQDELKIYDLVAKRFLAVFHPDAKFERTRVETDVEGNVFRTSGRRLVEPGWRAVYGDQPEGERGDDDSGGDQLLPRLEQGEQVETRSVEFLRKETQPPRRFSDASLLGAMETAGKEIEDAELREAMKDSGIGTPATRAGIIELLIGREYIEREGR